VQGEDKQQVSTADLVLVGHEEEAQFALGMGYEQPLVASGGIDTNVRALITSPLTPNNLKPPRTCRASERKLSTT
jgi:hypothetical protein